jgi:hypothetical protein
MIDTKNMSMEVVVTTNPGIIEETTMTVGTGTKRVLRSSINRNRVIRKNNSNLKNNNSNQRKYKSM